MDLNQVTLPCSDYETSFEFYRLLGLRLIVHSPPRYARFETSSGATLSLHCDDEPSASGIVVYFEVDDVDRKVRQLRSLGVDFEKEPKDQTWLWREAYLRDPAGNRLCIYNAGQNRRYPPWRSDPNDE